MLSWVLDTGKSTIPSRATVIVDRLRRIKPKAILEIGCGPGQLAAAIRDAGLAPAYTGIDFSEVALILRGRPVYSTAEYDTVVSAEFLEHVERTSRCSRGSARASR